MDSPAMREDYKLFTYVFMIRCSCLEMKRADLLQIYVSTRSMNHRGLAEVIWGLITSVFPTSPSAPPHRLMGAILIILSHNRNLWCDICTGC